MEKVASQEIRYKDIQTYAGLLTFDNTSMIFYITLSHSKKL